MTTVTAVTAFRSAEAVCKTSSRSSRLSRGAGAKVKGGIPAGGDCRKSIQPPYPLTFGPRKTLAGRWKGPWPFHPAQRRVTKFRRGAGCPFQRAALLGEATAVAGGKAPHHPVGRKCAFDGRQAVKSAFALLSQKVTKARRLRGGKGRRD